jgi:RHS repeat-associated protein
VPRNTAATLERGEPNGFYYLRARYYDPSTGQFVSRDPATAISKQPCDYVSDNPLNYEDRTGLLCLGSGAAGSADLGLGAGVAGQGSLVWVNCSADNWATHAVGSGGSFIGMRDTSNPNDSNDFGAGYPNCGNTRPTWGAGAGIGPQWMVSNASSSRDLEGPFQVTTFSAGFGLLWGSLSFARSGGTWEVGLTWTPLSTPTLSASQYDANTWSLPDWVNAFKPPW